MFAKHFLVYLFLLLSTSSLLAGDLLQLLPENTIFVEHVNLSKLLGNPNFKKNFENLLTAQLPLFKAQNDEFIKKTGFNPLNNLYSITTFFAADNDIIYAFQEGPIILLDGIFEPVKILDALKDEKAYISIEKSANYYSASFGDDNFTIMFLDNNTAVYGPSNRIKSVEATKNKQIKNILANRKFSDLLGKIDTNATIWIIAVIPEIIKPAIKSSPNPSIAAIDSLYANCIIDTNLKITFKAVAELNPQEDSKKLINFLNSYLSLLKKASDQATSQDPELTQIKRRLADFLGYPSLTLEQTTFLIKTLLSYLTIESTEAAIVITFEITEPQLIEIANKLATLQSEKPQKKPATNYEISPVIPAMNQ